MISILIFNLDFELETEKGHNKLNSWDPFAIQIR